MLVLNKDIDPYVCSANTPISAVLKRIDSSKFLFQLIVDESCRLLGTVTDGDIRRAMLKGIGLDEPASACMHSDPRTGKVGDTVANARMLASVGTNRPFLPILDPEGRVVEILVKADTDAGIAQALVMAGGYGRRLGDRTRETPKPLLPIGGRPILDHVIGGLESAGVHNVTIAIHYLGEQIRQYVEGRNSRAEINIVEEREPLGTAGALGLLHDLGRNPLLIVNGDVLTDCDFGALIEFHDRHRHDGTVAVARYDVQVPYGVVRHSEDGAFSGIDEKPVISSFIAAGVYYLEPAFLPLIPAGRAIDMPELLNAGRELGLNIGLFPIHEYWKDVGRPEDLYAADCKYSSEST